ncbi:MAG: fibronectin type III domain-containing protein [Gemmatimonadetes bacterium]|nr:fibronectin type III domain-containing protein [Gemmatimonadota bacterium]
MQFRRTLTWAAGLGLLAFAAGCGEDGPTEPTAPPVPTNLAVTQLSLTSVRVSWTASTGADRYVLERASAAQPGVFTAVGGSITGTSFDDTGLTAGTAYSYRVAAAAGTAVSGYAAPVSITTGLKAATVQANITASRTFYKDTVYTLKGFIKVTNGATLTIQAGTKIVGDLATPGSSLWILRGAKIDAQGTAAEPIVFTSANAPGNRKPGDWGGIIIIGNGIINRTGTPINTEGGSAGVAENYAGGNDNADNSGTLRYVRIEFAGYDISNGAGQELNALSMYAVGSGTRIEYIQTMSGLDDSFEWWGGAVDTRYLVSYESGDDHFDWTEGYAGRNQFLIALQTQRLVPASGAGSFSSDPRGFEADGCDPAPNSGCTVTTTTASTPYSRPVFANFTLVGPGQLGGFPADGNGIVLRRATAGILTNGIVARWPGVGFQVRDAFTDSLRLRDSLTVANMVLAENGPLAAQTHYDADGLDINPANESSRRYGQAAKYAARNHRTGTQAAALFTSLNPAGLDWTPKTTGGQPDPTTGGGTIVPTTLNARVAGYPYSGGWATTTYVGAAAPTGAKWWDGWTVYLIN